MISTEGLMKMNVQVRKIDESGDPVGDWIEIPDVIDATTSSRRPRIPVGEGSIIQPRLKKWAMWWQD